MIAESGVISLPTGERIERAYTRGKWIMVCTATRRFKIRRVSRKRDKNRQFTVRRS